jgi:hypothetical protein
MFELSNALTIRILAVVGALVAVLVAVSLLQVQEANAQVEDPTLQCQDLNQFPVSVASVVSGGEPDLACVSLTPKAATNDVGADHTVTATVSTEAGPMDGVCLYIVVIQGPNMGEQVSGVTNADGELSLTYTGSGTGTDMIGTEVALISESCSGFIDVCLADPDSCVDTFFEDPTCGGESDDQYLCDNATKEWVEPEVTAAPATATPEPTQAPEALPDTGAGPESDSAFAWLALLAGTLIVLLGFGIVSVARRRG